MGNTIGTVEKNALDSLANGLKTIAVNNIDSGTPNRYDFRIPAWIKALGTMLKKNPKMANVVFATTAGISGALVITGFIIGRKTAKPDLDKLSDKEIYEIAEKIVEEIDKHTKTTDHHEDGDQKE